MEEIKDGLLLKISLLVVTCLLASLVGKNIGSGPHDTLYLMRMS